MDKWNIAFWAGKIVFCGFFLMSGVNHLVKAKAMAAYSQSKQVPMAGVMVPLTGLMLIAGSLMILFRWHAIWGAGLIILFLVPAAFMMHNFWAEADPMQRANQQAHFWKNLTMAAGALLFAVATARGAY